MRTHAAFENNFDLMLDKNAPKKTKTLWGNQKLHFDQNVRRQIMIRSRLENKASKSKNFGDIFKWRRNLLANLNK